MTRSTKIRPFIQEGEIKASSGSITLTNPSPLSSILKLHILVNHTILLNLKCAQNEPKNIKLWGGLGCNGVHIQENSQ